MAMHKSKKTKRFQPGGLVDSEGRPVRDGSGQPIMTGSFPEEDEITARGRAKNAEMFKSLFNRATGRGKSAQDEAGKVAQMEAAREKLGRETQAYVKNKGDADRLSYDAEQGAKAPTSLAKVSDGMDESDRRREAAESAPKRQDSVKTKPKVVTKPKTSKPAGAPGFLDPQQKAQQKDKGPYRDEGRNRPAPAAPAKKPEQSPVTAFPINPGVLKQREADEKRREERREFGRQRDAKEKAEKEKKREAAKSMSPSERSAARGKAVKEFFGINTKKPLDAKGATIQSMDTDMMRAAGRAAAKEQGQKRKVESSYKKGGSVSSASKRADGIAQRGKTRGKVY
jgi:hypothetical protein